MTNEATTEWWQNKTGAVIPEWLQGRGTGESGRSLTVFKQLSKGDSLDIISVYPNEWLSVTEECIIVTGGTINFYQDDVLLGFGVVKTASNLSDRQAAAALAGIESYTHISWPDYPHASQIVHEWVEESKK